MNKEARQLIECAIGICHVNTKMYDEIWDKMLWDNLRECLETALRVEDGVEQ